MSTITITRPRDPVPDLTRAMRNTDSAGWMADAVPLVVRRGETILAVIVIQNIAGRRAEGHLDTYGPRWCHPDVLRAVFTYLRLRMQIDNLRIPMMRRNIGAQVAALKAGFEIDGVIRGGSCDGSDAIMMSRDTIVPNGSPRPRPSQETPGRMLVLED